MGLSKTVKVSMLERFSEGVKRKFEKKQIYLKLRKRDEIRLDDEGKPLLYGDIDKELESET
jgi:hypothetical protein